MLSDLNPLLDLQYIYPVAAPSNTASPASCLFSKEKKLIKNNQTQSNYNTSEDCAVKVQLIACN